MNSGDEGGGEEGEKEKEKKKYRRIEHNDEVIHQRIYGCQFFADSACTVCCSYRRSFVSWWFSENRNTNCLSTHLGMGKVLSLTMQFDSSLLLAEGSPVVNQLVWTYRTFGT